VETSQQHRSSFVDGDRSVRGATDVCIDDVVWAFLNGFDVVRSYWYFHIRIKHRLSAATTSLESK
jgi:hypothetical protein